MEETGEIVEHIAVKGDLELNLDTLKMIPCPYVDIITEFADVEIFLISFDSLLLELCAHRYHNWILGGQTIVISEQFKHFLCALEELNAKFKIVVFSDLSVLFNKNAYLSFLYSYLLRFLTSSKWNGDIEIFNSPLDKRWNTFLHQLTPSFILMSLENASPREIFGIEKIIDEKDKKKKKITIYEDIDFASFFISTAFQLINEAIPVVLFNAFTINFTSVMSFRFSTVPINISNLNKKIAALWTKISEEKQLNKIESQQQIQKQISECKTAAQFWAYVICEAMKGTDYKNDANFEYVCMSVILSALVCSRLGTGRKYLEEEENDWREDPALNKFKYLQLNGKVFLEQSLRDPKCINFPLEDLWDGRMILSLYRKIVDKKTIKTDTQDDIDSQNSKPKGPQKSKTNEPVITKIEEPIKIDLQKDRKKERQKEDKKKKEALAHNKRKTKQKHKDPSSQNAGEGDSLDPNSEGLEQTNNSLELNGHCHINGTQNSNQILPLRVQKEFADLHGVVGFKVSIPTDVKEELLDQLSPSEAPATRMDRCQLYAVKNEFLDQYIPDVQSLVTDSKIVPLSTFEHDYAKIIDHAYKWNFEPIGDPLMLQEEKQREYEKKQLQDARKAKKLIWQRQNLSAWYQLFSDSLEGQGGQLLVDFSRVVKAPVITEDTDNENSRPSSQMSKKGGPKKEVKGAKKGGKPGAGGLSKKDQILQQNMDAKRKQQMESDKLKIEYATRLKTNTLNALDELLKRLDLDESKALCMYQKVIRYADAFTEQLTTFENIDHKREGALGLVESVKAMFVKYYNFLDEQQKEKILYLWASLGFGKPELKRRPDKQMDLQIDLIHYQLKYGGRMIDVLTELATKKDDRVTGFSPDAWQRKMLDAVDQDKSALIVAPTSAGKTFVSYYCIEKVLRKSDDDVVVYISPSKPLTNQIVGSVYARFRGKAMSSGKVLYGIFNNEIIDNVLNCQVLVTIPECFEQILLSSDPRCQAFVSRIKYVILDEVHCINQKDTQGRSIGYVWEHIFLLIRCPFLALSATISNVDELKDWLKSAEQAKPLEGLPAREVELITYDERWSELELSLQRLSVSSKDSVSEENGKESKQEDESKSDWNDVVQYFNPFAVYKLEKLRMFGIPADQRLTARQVLELYEFMASIDDSVKKEFEPTKYFIQLCRADEKSPDGGAVWLNRKDLRKFENALKNRFVQWMNEDKTKIDKIFERLEKEVSEEFEKRSKPYDMRKSALNNIMPLIDQLKRKEQLPALCFNDDRDICEKLAKHIFKELQKREESYKASPEFQKKYNLKAEEKALKLAKRKRDEEERAAKRKGKRVDEEGNEERFEKDDMEEEGDAFALMKIRMREDLERFKLFCRWSDEDIYNRCIDKLSKKIHRPEARMLLELFQRGIGFHHDGLSNAERSAVEVLFRRGFLGIVFSTSTLALGMNLPCKTVIFGIDTPKLTPLQFRQMSGRAGRRGFDPAGTVIFMSLPTNKIRRLLTASLATLRGNVPFTTAFLLRLISFVNGELSKDQQKFAKNTRTQGGLVKSSKLDNNDISNEDVRRKAALTLLKVPFVLQTHNGNFGNLLRFLTFFYVQLLRRMQLLDEKCIPRGFAHFALHLSQYDPGSLVFIHILQTGVLHRYIHTTYEDLFHEEQKTKAKEDIIFILAHIFTQKLVSLNVVDEQNLEKEPVLPALPKSIEDSINEYNKSVEELALASLQLGSSNRRLENPIIALSGFTEESLQLSRGQIDFASVFNSDLQLDERFIPFVQIDRFDHRGRKIYKNSYALDFWKNPDADALVYRNRLSVAERWYLINDFSKLLNDIATGIESIANKKDDLYKLIVGISSEDRLGIADEYEDKFRKAFKMKRRFVEEKTGDAETSEKKGLNIRENE
ncbi:hypothetical protein ACQ4LE_005937 [Meloidogyne hapla]